MKLKELMKAMPSTQKFALTDVTTEKAVEGNVWLFFHGFFADEISGLPESEVISLTPVDNAIKIFVRTENGITESTEDKEHFVQEFGKLLHVYDARTGVESMEYIQEGYEEFVLITFDNGEQKKKFITGDSCLAILNDVYKMLC